MAKLIYAALTSLDGYTTFINDVERPIGTYLYGRRMYQTMAAWETPETIPDRTPAMLDFARIWQAADKIVYSRTLQTVSTSRTRLERAFDSKAVRKLKADASRDVAIGGPALAANAIRAGLVDEYHMFVAPIIVGGGSHYLPGKVRIELDLMDQRRFANGMAHLRYRARSWVSSPPRS